MAQAGPRAELAPAELKTMKYKARGSSGVSVKVDQTQATLALAVPYSRSIPGWRRRHAKTCSDVFEHLAVST